MPATTEYPRGRTPRAVREAQMVAAAERLFSEHGYHGVSMDQIAAASGITKPMLYEYFGSKEGLFLACMERARGQLFEAIGGAVRATDDAEAALRAGIEAFLTVADEQRATWPVLFGEGGRFNEAAAAIRAEQAGLIAQLLRELPGWKREPDRRAARRDRAHLRRRRRGDRLLGGRPARHPRPARGRSPHGGALARAARAPEPRLKGQP